MFIFGCQKKYWHLNEKVRVFLLLSILQYLSTLPRKSFKQESKACLCLLEWYLLERTRVTLVNRIKATMAGLVAKLQRIHWKPIVYLSARLWLSEYFQTIDMEKSFQEIRAHYTSPQKPQTKYGKIFMKGLDFLLLCISVWTPYPWEAPNNVKLTSKYAIFVCNELWYG